MVEGPSGFEKYILKDFKVIGEYNSKMQLDFALDVLTIIDPVTITLENTKTK